MTVSSPSQPTKLVEIEPLIEAWQIASSTALASLREYLNTGDQERLHAWCSWTYTADSERDKIKAALAW